jgi:hypothetical protein
LEGVNFDTCIHVHMACVGYSKASTVSYRVNGCIVVYTLHSWKTGVL